MVDRNRFIVRGILLVLIFILEKFTARITLNWRIVIKLSFYRFLNVLSWLLALRSALLGLCLCFCEVAELLFSTIFIHLSNLIISLSLQCLDVISFNVPLLRAALFLIFTNLYILVLSCWIFCLFGSIFCRNSFHLCFASLVLTIGCWGLRLFILRPLLVLWVLITLL